eukprot:m.39322 g.39322  ORF g.39322 m.39322 type:complete len:98 (-) comp11769_c0_seq2:652-945(-)
MADQHAVADFLEMVQNASDDKSRLRLIRSWVGDHSLSCEQAVSMLACFLGLGDTKVQAGALFYPRLTDPQNFESAFLAKAYRYEEERADLRKRLNLA